MSIQTPNFTLRPFTQADLQNVFKGLSHPLVIPYYGVSFKTLEETQTQIDWFETIERENTGRWRAICSKDLSTFCGAVGFNYWSQEHKKAEIGFWLLPDFWRKGIIKEVVPRMVEYGFKEMGLHRIEAEVETGNTASKNVLTGLGFKFEGTKRDCEIKGGRFISLDIFSMLSTDAMT